VAGRGQGSKGVVRGVELVSCQYLQPVSHCNSCLCSLKQAHPSPSLIHVHWPCPCCCCPLALLLTPPPSPERCLSVASLPQPSLTHVRPLFPCCCCPTHLPCTLNSPGSCVLQAAVAAAAGVTAGSGPFRCDTHTATPGSTWGSRPSLQGEKTEGTFGGGGRWKMGPTLSTQGKQREDIVSKQTFCKAICLGTPLTPPLNECQHFPSPVFLHVLCRPRVYGGIYCMCQQAHCRV
jgi:hypothetical protein